MGKQIVSLLYEERALNPEDLGDTRTPYLKIERDILATFCWLPCAFSQAPLGAQETFVLMAICIFSAYGAYVHLTNDETKVQSRRISPTLV
jgi:hypothetical protein